MYSHYNPFVDFTSAHHDAQTKPDPFKMTDDQIKSLVYATRGTPDDSFDSDSLFVIVDNILMRSTQIVDEVMQTGKAVSTAAKLTDEKSPKSNFTVPLCTLKQISSEISCCKDLTVEIAHEVTIAILAKLVNYPWKARAGLVMAALAMEFGDFLVFVELDQGNQLTKSLAVLKGLAYHKNRPELRQQRKAAVIELNGLVKATLRLLHAVFELDKVSIFDPRAVDALSIDVAVYWIVITVVACAKKVAILMGDDMNKSLNISLYEKKVHFILNNLTNYLNNLRERKEYDAYCHLLKLRKIPHEAMRFLSCLFSLKETDAEIIDGCNNFNKVSINVLENKKIIFFISRKNISDEDVFTMKLIQSNKIIKENNQYRYAVVWVPVLEEGERFEDFEIAVCAKDIRCYIMKPVSHFLGRRFLKEEWRFRSDTTAVVYSAAEGRELNLNAYHTFKSLGLDAFPFDAEFGKLTPDAAEWIVPLFKGFADQSIVAKIDKWVNKKSYIFFHGGRDKQWATQIAEITNTFLKINKEQYALTGRVAETITIKRFDVEESAEVRERFWQGVQGLFLIRLDKRDRDEENALKRQVDRLYSYKSEDAWFVFNVGPATVAVGDRFTLSKVAEEMAGRAWTWGPAAKAFLAAFVERHEAVSRENVGRIRCCRIEIPPEASWRLPEKIGCPVCRARMESVTSYVCCHGSGHRHY